MTEDARSDLLWLVAVAGLLLGVIVTVIGLVLLESGPAPLIVGVILLAFGGAAFFTRQSRG